MRKRVALIGFAIAALALTALVPAAFAQDGPEQVDIEHEGLFPEGVEYDAERGHFLVGSLAEGTIFSVQDDGTIEPLIENEDLMASVGIHIDAERDRLLVANTDPGMLQGQPSGGPQATLAAFDLETGDELFLADLGAVGPEGQHFANDVTVDADGNAYVTDSFSSVIYKVDTEGNASVFLQDDRFASQEFGLNGIDYHPDGYLIAVKSSEGALFKVPVDDPGAVTQVQLDTPVSGGDGIVFYPDGSLIVVGSPQSVFHVVSSDGWQTANVVESVQLQQAGTTATVRDGAVYVVFAHINEMGAGDPPDVFEIVRADMQTLEAAPDADAGG